MSKFIQIHLLTSYPPSNPNRDDLGRPKTAIMGGATRLRISSQSLKRAWRESDIFEQATGRRTKEIAVRIMSALMNSRTLEDEIWKDDLKEGKPVVDEKTAKKWALAIASAFVDKIGKSKNEDKEQETNEGETEEKKDGKKKKEKKSNVDPETLKGEQIVFYTPEEIKEIDKLLEKLIKDNKRDPQENELKDLLKKENSGADVAMFGRMLANAPKFNIEAACQVAHAITVHKVAVEDDFFTAVDDLNKGDVDAGSAHMGETEFSAGIFYLYICIDKDLLIKNLNGNKELAEKSIAALVESAATVAPSGKQNSFANRVRASYILAEKGNQQPRSLSVAFLTGKSTLVENAVMELEAQRDEMDRAYGKCYEDKKVMNQVAKTGTLKEITEFVKG